VRRFTPLVRLGGILGGTYGRLNAEGAAVEFDPQSNRFRFKSQEKVDAEARADGTVQEINRLLALRTSLKSHDKDLGKTAINDAIANAIARLSPVTGQ
jgi:hypothetical protein